MSSETKIQNIVPGNNPDAKVSLYEIVLNESQKARFYCAINVHSLDEEIALLRVILMFLWENDPLNFNLMIRVILTIDKMSRTRYALFGNQHGFLEAVTNIVRDIAVPLGAAVLSKK